VVAVFFSSVLLRGGVVLVVFGGFFGFGFGT